MAYKPSGLGHVTLFVGDVDRSEKFYADVLCLDTRERWQGRAVFMWADSRQSHELALIQLSADVPAPEEDRVSLHHVAWRMESFEDLKEAYQRLKDKDVKIVGIGDHGISLGVYFHDPDGNGNEAYYELPREEWTADGQIFTGHFPMSLEDGLPA